MAWGWEPDMQWKLKIVQRQINTLVIPLFDNKKNTVFLKHRK